MLSRKIWLILGVTALLALLAFAWVDGGREPLREIAVDIPVPGAAL